MRGAFDPGVDEEQWCARRLLARIHAYTQHRLRREIEPVTTQELVRFLLQWQHVAPGSQRQGRAGVLAVVDQLQGFEIPAGAWEEAVLPARVEGYQHRWLEDLCHSGELVWGRLSPRAADAEGTLRRGSATPSRATPVTFALREDLPWLLRAGARRRRRRPSPSTGRRATCSTPCGPVGRCSTPSCAPPPDAFPSRWRKGSGTWWRAASSPPTGSRPSVHCSRRARPGNGASATSNASGPGYAAPPPGARAARGAGRCCPRPGPTTRPTTRPSPSRSPGSCWPVGAWCSGTSWRARASPCPGARWCGRCAGSRPGASCAGAGS